MFRGKFDLTELTLDLAVKHRPLTIEDITSRSTTKLFLLHEEIRKALSDTFPIVNGKMKDGKKWTEIIHVAKSQWNLSSMP